MATVPEYGTLGFNRGRAMNEPMSREQYDLTAGAVGYAIGMLGIVVLVIWNLL